MAFRDMSRLKKFGIILLSILLLLTILGIIISKDVHVSRTQNIKAPVSYVYNLLNDVKSTPTWNSWTMEDDSLLLSYGDTTIGVGATYYWEGPKTGMGSITITEAEKDKKIVANMNFDGDKDNTITYQFLPKENGTTDLTWSMDSRLGFPFNLMKWFFKFTMKRSFKSSMNNMNTELESRQKGIYYSYQINEVPMNERHYLMSRSKIERDQMEMFYSQNLGAIFTKVQSENILMDGMPSGLFFNTNHLAKQLDMAAAIPLKARVDMADLSSITLPIAPVLTVDYYGDYKSTDQAHQAIRSYIRDRNYKMKVPYIEEYVTDPLKEKDPSKWLTKIMYYYNI